MESEEIMILRDMPVDTRNYTIIDNITGKAIDQSNYTLSIDNEVISKLNKLKKINEEKIKQAALRDKYGDTTTVSTFTPEDNAVFTPVYNDEYLDYRDFNTQEEKPVEEVVEDTAPVEEFFEVEKAPEPSKATEVIQSNTLLDRVVARDPSVKEALEQEALQQAQQEEQTEELDYITSYTPTDSSSNTTETQSEELSADNSLFTPEMATLQQASEQIVNIDQNKLGQDIKAHKDQRVGTEKIKLDKMEILSGKKFAWLAYILFFLPLLFKRKNRFVRLHANEGLELNIMEIISALLIGQYFILPTLMETMTDNWAMVSLIGAVIGGGVLVACAISAISMLICSMFGLVYQTPWLWRRRIIKVSNERTSDD